MKRRAFLATTALLTTGTTVGCISGSDDSTAGDSNGETDGGSDSVSDENTADTTPTDTPSTPDDQPEWVDSNCQPVPDIEGLPSPPETLTEDSVVSYVREFEPVYVVATNEQYGAIDSIDVTNVEEDNGYHVDIAVEGSAPTPADEENATRTPVPADGTSHRATYRIAGAYLVRDFRAYASEAVLDSACWTLESS
jgi:hypothetical protein